jgi:hypothetical protein
VLNVVHGDKSAVDAILTHPLIRAVSFVGSSDIAHYVYQTGTAHGKRVQAMGGAKNHGIVLPDADLDQVVKDLSGAAFGSAGERCMALPVVVPVGKKTADELRERMVAEIETLKVGISTDTAAHYGPVVSAAHRAKIADYIQIGVDEGAELVVDGRDFALQGFEKGFFIGPSLFDGVKKGMKTYQEEIFGPVLQIVRAESFEEALTLPSEHQYGNGVAIFTRNGRAAREFASRVNVGMVGINVPIPVPVAYHTFGGWKRGVRRHQPARRRGREVLHQGQDDHRAVAGGRARGRRLRHPDDEIGQEAGAMRRMAGAFTVVAPFLMGLVLSTTALAQRLDAAEMAAVGQYGQRAAPLTVFERAGVLRVDGQGRKDARLTPLGRGRYRIEGGGELVLEPVAVRLDGTRLPRHDFGAEVEAGIRAAVRADPAALRARALAAKPPAETASTGPPTWSICRPWTRRSASTSATPVRTTSWACRCTSARRPICSAPPPWPWRAPPRR